MLLIIMPKYSQSNLLKRDTIIQSHKLLGEILDADMINILINLFSKTSNN
jgi:hypothetical protein